jgi:hypothetical protein
VSRDFASRITARRHAERGQQSLRRLGLTARLVEDAGIAARKRDLRLGEAARQHDNLNDALGRLVQRRRPARVADQPVLGAPENDETGRRRRIVEIGPGEAVLERQDQRVAERR